jgi:hypothetical protein
MTGSQRSPRAAPPTPSESQRGAAQGCVVLTGGHREAESSFRTATPAARWLANIATLRERFPDDATFYIGHGGPVGGDTWDWQRGYIDTFIAAVGDADWAKPERAQAEVVARMKQYEPSDELQVLVELSVEPVARQLGTLTTASAKRRRRSGLIGRHSMTGLAMAAGSRPATIQPAPAAMSGTPITARARYWNGTSLKYASSS